MKNNSKVQTFIGFSLRARACKIGLNAISTLKRAYVMLLCKSTGESTKKKAFSLSKKFNCEILITSKENLSFYSNRENSKVIAITDKALAKAIKENAQEDFSSLGDI